MKHIYFVSYHYKRDEANFGWGMVSITWHKQIDSFAELLEIASTVATHDRVESVVIVNFQLLRVEP